MITLIVPVYRNEDSIPSLLFAVEELSSYLKNDMQAVFVIDGSPDQCFELLRNELPKQHFHSKLILLSKNFGSFAAIRIGLAVGDGDYFVTMAADLQEPMQLVIDMTNALRHEEIDVALAIRNGREDPFFSRIPAQLFWTFYRRYVVPEIPVGGIDTFACTREFRDHLLQLEERNSSLIAQIFWLGFKRKYIAYTRQKRQHGKSAWTFQRKLIYLMDSIFAFTDLPIRILIRIGGIGVIFSSLLGLIALIAKISGHIKIPGYTITLLTITFLGTLNLLGLGIVGSYAWRTFENTKQRPLAIAIKSLTFEGK